MVDYFTKLNFIDNILWSGAVRTDNDSDNSNDTKDNDNNKAQFALVHFGFCQMSLKTGNLIQNQFFY